MMQLPPTSISLLSEMFNSNNNAANLSNAVNGEIRSSGERNERKQQQQRLQTTHNQSVALPSPDSREELAYPSFSKPNSGSSRKVRYHPSVSAREADDSSSRARRTGRRRSPPQKIHRAPDADEDLSSSSSSSRSSSRREEERDVDVDEIEQQPRSAALSGPITCFSYRTMEKEYEEDTRRMLERIRKSRSFERSESPNPSTSTTATPTPYRPLNSCHPPNKDSATTHLESSECKPTEGEEEEESGFFIGDLTDGIDGVGRYFAEEGYGGSSSSSPPSLALLSSYGDMDGSSDRYSSYAEDDCGGGDDEIFELDL